VANALSHMLDFTKQSGILDQRTNVILFLLQLMWLHDISKYLTTKKVSIHYNQEQKKNLENFTFSLGIGKIISSRSKPS
jgi:hypothetical protein